MTPLIIDSSFYISLVYPQDSNHPQAKKIYRRLIADRYRQITTEDFLKESLTHLSQRVGRNIAIMFYQELITNTQVISIATDYFQQGLKLFLNPKLNKDISLVDCIAAVVHKDIANSVVLTFDPHFKSLGCKIYHLIGSNV